MTNKMTYETIAERRAFEKRYREKNSNITISRELISQLQRYKERGETYTKMIKFLLNYWEENNKK